MGAQLSALVGGAEVVPLSGGYSGETFLVTGAGEQAVLRLYARHPERAAVDQALLERLRGLLPVPRVLEAVTVPAGPDRPPFLLLEALPGDRLDLVLPAAEHMFTAEIGYPPYRGNDRGYRASLSSLAARGHTFVVLEKGRVVIFGAGAGMPFFSTDTVAAQRALETKCEVVLMAKQGVDGLYSADPNLDPTATKYDTISYQDVLLQGLKAADATLAEAVAAVRGATVAVS